MFSSSSPRNWFPVILAGLTILLAIVFYATNRSVDFSTWSTWWGSHDGAQTKGVVEVPAVTETEYQSAVRTIYSTYQTDGDVQKAYDAFIQLRVPVSMQAFHIDLVIAFGKLAAKDVSEGESRLNAILAQHSWLSL